MSHSVILFLCTRVRKDKLLAWAHACTDWPDRGWSYPHLDPCEWGTEAGSLSEPQPLCVWAETGACHSQFLFPPNIDQWLFKGEESLPNRFVAGHFFVFLFGFMSTGNETFWYLLMEIKRIPLFSNRNKIFPYRSKRKSLYKKAFISSSGILKIEWID